MSFSSSPKPTTVPLSNMSSPTHVSGKTLSASMGGESSSVGLSSLSNSLPLGSKPEISSSRFRVTSSYLTVGILCFINLINYMDRFTIAGVLDSVETFYSIGNTKAGVIQTSFIICYMIMAPIFGYLGDRYNRTYIMAAGVLFWSTTTFLGSFIPSGYFGVFIALRALVGTGEASYSTIAPTIIADLFQGSMRSKMLAVFYFAIPIGSGLGYIVGSNVATALHNWQWALRVTPGLGVLATLLILLFVRDPPQGSSDGGEHLENTALVEDLKDLSHNRSFVLSTFGFTCVAFATGALAWWAPMYFQAASKVYGTNESINTVGLKFGVITCVAGLFGVILGSAGAQFYRKYNEKADPLVCAGGILLSAPLLFLGCVIAHKIPELSWFLIFLGEMFLCVNWPIVADILLYVVVPTRRSIAEAFQILLSHALGDAFSPYIIGAVSDSVRSKLPETAVNEYQSLQYAMYITCFVLVLGGGLFLWCTHYIVEDRERCKRITNPNNEDETSATSELPNPVEGDQYTDTDNTTDERQLIT